MNRTIKGMKQENEEQHKTRVRNTKGMNKTIRKISNKLKQNKVNKQENKKELQK